MKIAMQITTPSMGDIVIEVMEEKNTTNVEQQKGILTELIFDVLHKIQAVYQIPQEMLDIGEYENADSRFQKQQALPKPSSAERNRQEAMIHHEINSPQTKKKNKKKKNKPSHNSKSEPVEEMDDDYLELTEEEQILALSFIHTLRQFSED